MPWDRRIEPFLARYPALRAIGNTPLVPVSMFWIDATSADYLAFLAESLAGLRVLVLTTYRPGHTVRWADKTLHTDRPRRPR